jgi:hypothetical protein
MHGSLTQAWALVLCCGFPEFISAAMSASFSMFLFANKVFKDPRTDKKSNTIPSQASKPLLPPS